MNVKRVVPKTPGGWLTALLLVIILVVAAYQAGNPHSFSEAVARVRETGSGPAATLSNVSSVDQLKGAFNQCAGHPRLILLLSPT